jgi:hypothetical protein
VAKVAFSRIEEDSNWDYFCTNDVGWHHDVVSENVGIARIRAEEWGSAFDGIQREK